MSSYTNGEWKAEMGYQNIFIVATQKNGRSIKHLAVADIPCSNDNSEANAQLISAAPDMYIAGQALDYTIGCAIIEIAKANGLDKKLIETIESYILPAQKLWRKSIAKAEGKDA